MVTNSVYFDMPSFKKAAVEACSKALVSASKHYKTSENGKKKFTDAIGAIIGLYGMEAKSLDPILVTLSKQGYLPNLMLNDTLRPMVEDEPQLLARLLEIQLGVGPWKDKS